MNNYTKKQKWKLGLFVSALLIIFASLWYTNSLVNNIAREERKKVTLWAEAIRKKANLVKYTNELFEKIKEEERKRMEVWAKAEQNLPVTEDDAAREFYLKILGSNTTIPVILTDDQNNIVTWLNFDSIKVNSSDSLKKEELNYLNNEIRIMQSQHVPIEIDITRGLKNRLFYKDSRLFSDLKTVLDDIIKSFISEVAINSASVPVIFTDSTRKNIIAFGNIDSVKIKDPGYAKRTLEEMAYENNPIPIELGQGEKNYIFYHDSYLRTQLKYFPYVQLAVIGLFLLIAYTLFSTSRKSEQNQVWVGMAKETAHQLGTPLSSLLAWLEYLDMKGVDKTMVNEIRQDVKRLETITERFSKIGSIPVLSKENIFEVLEKSVNYLKTRTSQNVSYSINTSDKNLTAQLNVPLFEWVIENLCRNAVDAMDGKGSILITISDQMQFVYIDVGDTGKGISKSKFKTVFDPGFTTKKRGWGLGLSLSKRIIENYHFGKIFVKRSEHEKGTTFRIVLNK